MLQNLEKGYVSSVKCWATSFDLTVMFIFLLVSTILTSLRLGLGTALAVLFSDTTEESVLLWIA